MDRYLNYSHGLELYPDINQGRRQNENGILFYVEALVLKKQLNQLTEEDKQDFIKIVKNLRTKNKRGHVVEGLFDRGQGESYLDIEPQVRMISHDNLTAISIGSELFDLDYHHEIALHGIQNFFMFDNGQPESPRFLYHKLNGKRDTSWKMHPRDWFFWLFNSKLKVLSYLFFPIFFASQIAACFTKKDNTSGKMLLWCRLIHRKELLLKATWWFCNKILKKRYSDSWISDVSIIYFNQTAENPVRVLAAKL